MEYVQRKFLETIEQYHMLRQGGRVVADFTASGESHPALKRTFWHKV